MKPTPTTLLLLSAAFTAAPLLAQENAPAKKPRRDKPNTEAAAPAPEPEHPKNLENVSPIEIESDRVFPRSENFGTAMTLLALCEPRRARPPAGWLPASTRAEPGPEVETEPGTEPKK